MVDPRIPPPCFLMACVGRPGEGKTTAIQSLLLTPISEGGLRGYFKAVYLFSPSGFSPRNAWGHVGIEKRRVFNDYADSSFESVMAEVATMPRDARVLIIFDDLAGHPQLYQPMGSSSAMRAALVHRHYAGGVSMAFLVQSYNSIPSRVRKSLTDVLFFGRQAADTLTSISREITGGDVSERELTSLMERALDRPHSFLYVHRNPRDGGRLVFRKRFGEELHSARALLSLAK